MYRKWNCQGPVWGGPITIRSWYPLISSIRYNPPPQIKKQTLIDGRTKAYRQHREKLEKARLKRIESQRKPSKFVENIVSNMSEMSYGSGSHGAIRPQADMSNVQASKHVTKK